MNIPGAAHQVLADGVIHLDEQPAVFEAMLSGWEKQQKSRLLGGSTVKDRLNLIRRFQRFCNEYPWNWTPADLEGFTSSLMDLERAHSTLRGYQTDIGLFCDYITDERYDWPEQCFNRFGTAPVQICHEWNTAVHLSEYEGRPERRAMTHDEIEAFFDHADARVQRIVDAGRKGALAALRDSQMFKTIYAYGLRRRELARLDLVDLRHNPAVGHWGRYGALHVRYGKATKGSPPRRRLVLTVPEFDWIVDGMKQWVGVARPRYNAGAHPALWVTERRSRVSTRYIDDRFAEIRDELELDKALVPHCLRHSYVSHLAEFGYPEKFIQEQVGHFYSSTTAIYTHVSNDFKNRVLATALDRVYTPAGGGSR
ncbi:tyrosine-type recombinase/integrase [Streptomyces sp. NPDC051664]|uniref:tyrosine-type recombinase/integrase n=1 Tax=Streptomyces sp. NPDC051664 TaxID=3365668 RepID=UPI0037B597D4